MVETKSYYAQSFKAALSGFKLLIWYTQSIQSFYNTRTIYLYSTFKLCHLMAVLEEQGALRGILEQN